MKTFSILILLTFVGLSLSSCGNKKDDINQKMDDTARYTPPPKKNPTDTNENVSQDANSEEKKSTDKPLTEKTPGGIKINFPTNATEVAINGKIDGMKSITYIIGVSKGQTLTGSIEAVSESGKEQGNIRFSQIITPSGEADGPFGPTIKYELTDSGDWKFVVNENQMSGDPWSGDFKMVIGIR